MGSFARSGSVFNLASLGAVFVLGAVPLMLLRWKLNVMSFGEEEARALGINTTRVRLVVIIAATLLTASTVALCGVIGWVGLVIPHMCRFLVGPNYLALLPSSMLLGACFMLGVDNVARSATAGEIPLSIVTSLIGAPIFLHLLFRGQKSWAE
jgi:iron complex transport system permease protein